MVSPVSRKVFVEGGGDNDALRTECRKAFRVLLEKAGIAGRMPRIVACGARARAFDQFRTALRQLGPEDMALLLVDAEAPVTAGEPWLHVEQRAGDGWTRPAGAEEAHLHFMVQVMESWFLADRAALRSFFGGGFRESVLPSPGTPIEAVSKDDLYRQLCEATRNCGSKGEYRKSKHSFKLLATLDPAHIRKASPWADRFFATLERQPPQR